MTTSLFSATILPSMRERLTVHQRVYFQEVRAAAARSLEAPFDLQLRAANIVGVERNYQFHPTRKWEVDRAVPSIKVCAEIQGGIRGKQAMCHLCHSPVMQNVGGKWIPVRVGYGHSNAIKIQTDIDKCNALQEMGWLCAYISPDMVHDGSGLVLFKRFIDSRTLSSLR